MNCFNEINEIEPLDIPVKEELCTLKINMQNIIKKFEQDIPPWIYRSAEVKTSISSLINHPILPNQILKKNS